MRVLITGAQGQLGRELQRTIKEGCNSLGPCSSIWSNAEVDAANRKVLDIANAESVNSWFKRRGPYDVVFNCAAYTNVDGCEENGEEAFSVNAAGPENLARACALAGTTLVHVSTDYVFSGNVPGARLETDVTMPLSAYGSTKLEGERRAMSVNARTHIVRTAWLYGHEGNNFVRTMRNLGAKLSEVTVVDDQVGNPTNAEDLAFQMLRIALSDSYGIWHATCQGECSWADFAEAIMNEFELSCIVRRCSTAEWEKMHPGSARRPAYSSLDNERLREFVGDQMRSWQDALASFALTEKAKEGMRCG